MTELQQRARLIRDVLQKAVTDALERKRRLGQYAVIVRDGKPYYLQPGEHQLEDMSADISTTTPDSSETRPVK